MTKTRDFIAERLKECRKSKGLSVDEVGEAIDRSGKTVSAWEVGRGQPDADMMIELCRLYGVSIASFYPTEAVEGGDDGFIEVPLYGSIAAGTPIEMLPVDERHPVPTRVRSRFPDSFLLAVKGTSMNRILPDGCYALINPCKDVDVDGKPYAVCVNGFDATIKRVRKLANGFVLVPDSTDPTYTETVYNYNEPGTETITIIGEVVYYVLPFDWGF
jgi:repressor LexA